MPTTRSKRHTRAPATRPWPRTARRPRPRDWSIPADAPPDPPTVFVVDDDEAVRQSLHWLVESVGLRARAFESAQAFLDQFDPAAAGCLVLDVRMKGMSGLELLKHLRERAIDIPTIIITAHGDVPMAVQSMKLGAADFVEKPLNYQRLIERIHAALKTDDRRRRDTEASRLIRRRLAALSSRERQVLDGVVAGSMNRQIADELGLSPKTVEMHRSHVMKKMRAASLAELVRMVVTVRAGDSP